MASWTDRIQGLTGLTLGTAPAPSTAETLQFVRDAVRETRTRLMRTVPQDIPQFTKNATLSNEDGHDAEEALVVTSVVREDGVTNENYIPCTEVPFGMKFKVADTDSLWFRSNYNPCYYWDGPKIYVKPNPAAGGADDAIITYVPSSITQSGGSAIAVSSDVDNTDYFPDKYLHLTLWHTCVQVLTATMNNIHNNINSLMSDIVVPDVPTMVYQDLEMPTLPSYNPTPMVLDFDTVNAYFGAEDTELVGPAVNKVTQQISEFNSLSKDEQQRIQTELKKYDGELQKRFKQADGKLQAEVAQYQRRIEKYVQDIAKFGADLQSWSARYQWYSERYQSFAQQYLAFFGQLAPQQQEEKPERRRK